MHRAVCWNTCFLQAEDDCPRETQPVSSETHPQREGRPNTLRSFPRGSHQRPPKLEKLNMNQDKHCRIFHKHSAGVSIPFLGGAFLKHPKTYQDWHGQQRRWQLLHDVLKVPLFGVSFLSLLLSRLVSNVTGPAWTWDQSAETSEVHSKQAGSVSFSSETSI